MVTIVTQLYHSPVSACFRRLFESGYEIMVLTIQPCNKQVNNKVSHEIKFSKQLNFQNISYWLLNSFMADRIFPLLSIGRIHFEFMGLFSSNLLLRFLKVHSIQVSKQYRTLS